MPLDFSIKWLLQGFPESCFPTSQVLADRLYICLRGCQANPLHIGVPLCHWRAVRDEGTASQHVQRSLEYTHDLLGCFTVFSRSIFNTGVLPNRPEEELHLPIRHSLSGLVFTCGFIKLLATQQRRLEGCRMGPR